MRRNDLENERHDAVKKNLSGTENTNKEIDTAMHDATHTSPHAGIGNIILLQLVVMIYSIADVIAKFVSKQEFMSVRYLLLFALEFAALGLYAVLWQQAIKHFELSIAYVNKAMTLLWAMIWSIFIFHETLTLHNVLGVALVIAGIIVINKDEVETPCENDISTRAAEIDNEKEADR